MDLQQYCSQLERICSLWNNKTIIHSLPDFAVIGLTSKIITVSSENTPPVSKRHISTLSSYSMTLYVSLSSDNSPAV